MQPDIPGQFVSWSNGGAADQNYTVPAGLAGLTLTATYEPVGKLQVDSVPPGLPFIVDGAACTTPCILFDKDTRRAGTGVGSCFGHAGRLQALRVPFLEWRSHLHHLPGHDRRSRAGVRRQRIRRFTNSPSIPSRPAI